jgi:hypothetical protein
MTQRFIDLEEGDIADISSDTVIVYDDAGRKVERQIYVKAH